MDYTQLLNQFGWANIIVTILIWFMIFIWIWAILWVTKDISLRSENLFVQIISILMVTLLTPIIWFPLYFLIRPVQYKFDKNWWRESLLANSIQCIWCGNINPISCNNCTQCWVKLKVECKECKKAYPYEWEYCGNCWAPNIE